MEEHDRAAELRPDEPHGADDLIVVGRHGSGTGLLSPWRMSPSASPPMIRCMTTRPAPTSAGRHAIGDGIADRVRPGRS